MTSIRAVQVSEAGGRFQLVEREVPEPGRGQALVRVHACGICHSDSYAKEGGFPGVSYPLVPGHEIAGVLKGLHAVPRNHVVDESRGGIGIF